MALNQKNNLAVWATVITSLILAQPVRGEIQPELQKKEKLNQSQQQQNSPTSETEISHVRDIDFPPREVDAFFPKYFLNLTSSPTSIVQNNELTSITGIEIITTDNGAEILVDTLDGQSLQSLTSRDGNDVIIKLLNAQLDLPAGDSFQTNNPVDGIEQVTATQLDATTVQVTVTGTLDTPAAQILTNETGLTIGLSLPEALPEDAIDIVITATRTEEAVEDIPRSVTTITREQLETQTGTNSLNNLADILGEVVPGFGPPKFSNRRTRAQSLRGRRALILIDGVVQNTNFTNNTELNTIDPSAIERIEVVRGPIATYGSGSTGGIINIITRKPTENSFETTVGFGINADGVNFEGGGFGQNLQFGISGDEGVFDYRVMTSLNTTNTVVDADGDSIPADDLNGSRTLNGLIKLGAEFDDDQRLELTYNIYDDSHDSDVVSDPSIILEANPGKARAIDADLDYENQPGQTNQVASLVYTHDDIFWESQLDLQLFYQRTIFYRTLQDFRGLAAGLVPPQFIPTLPLVIQGNRKETKWGVRAQVETPLADTANLLWGLDYTNERNFSDDSIIDQTGLNATGTEGEVRSIGSFETAPPFTIDSIGLFAQGQWEATEQVILSGGLRYEHISADIQGFTASPFNNLTNLIFGIPLPEIEGGTNDQGDVVFNFGVVYKATEEFSTFINFSQGFAIPTLGFISGAQTGFDVTTDDLLDPEKVNNYEIGFRGNLDEVQLSLALFYNHSDKGQNLVISQGDANTAQGLTLIERSPQRNWGLEATVDWQPDENWSVGGTFTWNEGDADFPDDGQGFLPLSSVEVQPFKVTFYVANQTLPEWNNRLQLLWVGDRDRAFDEGVDQLDIDSFVTLDFLSTLKLGPGNLQVGIENLLNNQFLPVESQTEIGLTAFRRLAAPGRRITLRYVAEF